MISDLGPEQEFREFDGKKKWSEIYTKVRIRAMDNEHSLNDCKLPQFKGRNRYRDVYPYDHSRVRLERDGVDYINANLVESVQAKRKYILTQGPLAETCGHFWLMVWEQRSEAVLMLNKIIEKGTMKCHRYYPMGSNNGAEDELTFHDVDLRVEYICEDDCDYYTIRTLVLHDLRSGESREVLQFHYTSWPDFDVPSSPATFLDFLQSVRNSGALSQTCGPPVIHCSAGIGRSGTFCLVDTCLVLIEQQQDLKSLRVLEILLDMRDYRMGLIQTADQLRFSYLAILEGARKIVPNCVTSSLPDLSLINMSNSNDLDDLDKLEQHSSSDSDSDIPSEPPPPPPRPESTRQRPQSANAARGRTPHGGHPTSGVKPTQPVLTEEAAPQMETKAVPNAVTSQSDFQARDQLLQRGVEIRRRKREERQKNTQEQIGRMLEKQQASEMWKYRRTTLKPYLYGLSVAVVLGGLWIYKQYYT